MIDFNLSPGDPIKNRDIDLILQQIDILFDTKKKELLGNSGYGSFYERFLHQLKLSNSAVQHQVLSDLNSMELFGFSPKVEVYFLYGSQRDIALIDIILTRDEESYRKIYKIT